MRNKMRNIFRSHISTNSDGHLVIPSVVSISLLTLSVCLLAYLLFVAGLFAGRVAQLAVFEEQYSLLSCAACLLWLPAGLCAVWQSRIQARRRIWTVQKL